MKKTFYITTAIDYVNGVPHLGTAYEKITADIINRFKKLAGYDTHFLMGNDEHSQNVFKKAQELNMDPVKYCDMMEEKFTSAWGRLNVKFDDFIRTTAPRHKKTVSAFLQKIYDNGDIFKGYYEGFYCVSCERFYTEKELDENKNCPVHNTKPEWIKEENWFFRLSKYRDPLLEHIEKNPRFIRPEIRKNEIVNVLKEGLDDLSISRAGSTWGVQIPWDENSVTYVWFDALINYLSGIGYANDTEMYEKFWPANIHYIGKDITRFHCIYWPAMLMAAGVDLPETIFGHGFIMQSGAKLSKSSGNAMDLSTMIDELGAEPLRFYLASEVTLGQDGDFSVERFKEVYNSQLANDYGNLLNRTLTMVDKYHGRVVYKSSLEDELTKTVTEAVKKYYELFEDLRMKEAIQEAFRIITEGNLYIDNNKPWELAKDESSKEKLESVLHNLVDALRVFTILLYPVMPEKTSEAWRQLGFHNELDTILYEKILEDKTPEGHTTEKGSPVFPRME
ncbi:MAG: methionine--tRNA ligase [Acidobacteria bacterium]|nr:methionine--tRNA ligase [Acidobacteriota bacterium]